MTASHSFGMESSALISSSSRRSNMLGGIFEVIWEGMSPRKKGGLPESSS